MSAPTPDPDAVERDALAETIHNALIDRTSDHTWCEEVSEHVADAILVRSRQLQEAEPLGDSDGGKAGGPSVSAPAGDESWRTLGPPSNPWTTAAVAWLTEPAVSERTWMLGCDVAECSSMFAAHEDLRHGGESALGEARERAVGEGWRFEAGRDICPRHPVAPEPAVSEAAVEAAARAIFEDGTGDYTWAEMVSEDPKRADIWRDDARRVLIAALPRLAVQPEAEVRADELRKAVEECGFAMTAEMGHEAEVVLVKDLLDRADGIARTAPEGGEE